MAYPNPPDTGPQPQPRTISSSFSRPGSTIDDLMARFSSPNPIPAPPAMSSPFSSGSQQQQQQHMHMMTGPGNGSAAMSPPPALPGMGMGMSMGGYTPSSMFSPGGMMMSPALHGGPSPAPLYGASMNGGTGSAATPPPPSGVQAGRGGGGESRQSQLLDLLRSAGGGGGGQTPGGMPPSSSSSPVPSSHLYQHLGLGHSGGGQAQSHAPLMQQYPQQQQQQQQPSYGTHHHPAMQHNNSFSGLPSTGVNRVVSPTQGLMSAGAGTTQAQNLLAALING
jgi:hypothetical protein